jgi:CBS domain-containing protein
MAGIISERDYIKKVSLLGKVSKETKIKEIFTQDANVVTASVTDSIDVAMDKMMSKSIRHLPIVDESQKLVGFVSIKDLIKEVVTDKEDTLRALSDSVFGKQG